MLRGRGKPLLEGVWEMVHLVSACLEDIGLELCLDVATIRNQKNMLKKNKNSRAFGVFFQLTVS